MDKILEVEHLKKHYGQIKAVDDISFYVERGKLFAFLGPNGAGKSTTIDIICTFLKPDSGSVSIDGHVLGKDDDAIRSSIGVVFQDGFLDDLLTVEENIKYRGSFYGLKGKELQDAFDRVVEATGIKDFLKRQYKKLSGGQRRRSDIARALIHTPKILFLDEPTTGLDPQTRKKVWETIVKMQRDSDMTVFLTTHYMEEATEADYVIIIDNGKIAARGTPYDLRKNYANDSLRIEYRDLPSVEEILKGNKIEYQLHNGEALIPLKKTLDALQILELCKGQIESFEVLSGTLNDAFINITGKEIRE
ncbi:MAG: ABC transporter ATP-binding protein [Acidaminococcaceae bacterium]|jgi:multidrug/hemolysin transport system ATP-binding protein